MGSKPVLGYWNYRGFGHPIRFLLAYLGVDYDEKVYAVGPPPEHNMENWLKEKFNLGLDFPNVPYWIEGDLKITQIKAILKHIARTRGPLLLPTSSTSRIEGDMLETVITDIWMNLAGICYDSFKDSESIKSTQPQKLGELSNFLGDKEWILGKDITYLDFYLYECLYEHKVYDPKMLEIFPNFEAFLKRFENLPAIKSYMEMPDYISGPCISPRAKIQI